MEAQMVQHIPYWLLKSIKLYVQYLCASLAGIPAGLLAFGLIKSGMNEFASLFVAIVVGLVVAAFIWRTIDRVLVTSRQATIKTQPIVTSFNWQVHSIGGGAYLASTMIVVAAAVNTVDPPKPTTEYKSLNERCHTGTGTRIRMQPSANIRIENAAPIC